MGTCFLSWTGGDPSHEMFQEVINRGMSFVIRLGSSFSASVIKHPDQDFFVDYIPKGRKEPVRLHIVRVVPDDGTVETLATNLYNPAFTTEIFRELYFLRWVGGNYILRTERTHPGGRIFRKPSGRYTTGFLYIHIYVQPDGNPENRRGC